MKKIWVYLLGVLTGAILMIAVAFIISKASDSAYTFFDEPGEIMDARSYTVLQAGDGEALAYEHIFYLMPMSCCGIGKVNRTTMVKPLHLKGENVFVR